MRPQHDTSYFPPGSENKVIKRGYRQLGLTSFVYFTNTGSGGIACEQDPQSVPLGAFNYLTGIKRDGTPWLDATQNPPVPQNTVILVILKQVTAGGKVARAQLLKIAAV
jgi:hypothetical protein